MRKATDATSCPAFYRVYQERYTDGAHRERETFSAPQEEDGRSDGDRAAEDGEGLRGGAKWHGPLRVGVQARSIRKALSMVGGRYPQGEVRVAFPIEPEGFFVKEPSVLTGIVGSEQAHQEAA